MNRLILLFFCVAAVCVGQESRLRLIIETDAGGDPDDEQSLVRFLVYANEFDVEGIIANRPVARDRENNNLVREGLGIVRALVSAYGQCHANLVQHDPRFPTPGHLLARTVAGYDDTEDGVNLIVRAVTTATQASDLGVSPSGRHLTVQGKPFFWLGDTVWLLAQVPSREEIELYLRTRAEQGFTVIQLTAVMGEERVWGTTRATSRGDAPFIDHDVLKPAVTPGNDPADPMQYDYWDHLDYVLERIHAHGFRAALVTDFVGWGGDGYKFLKPANAHAYGRFLGARYRGRPEIIWVLGGDNTPKTDAQKAVWPLVAKGLAEGLTGKEDYSQVLMTYHINGGASSAQLWHNSVWLDFNMAQTWDAYHTIYPSLLRDYERVPAKPCGLGEGAYEDGPQYPTKPINALVIRQQACWSWFAGGYHTYGNGNVWHFDTCKSELTQTWTEALRSPGAATLRHAKEFLTRIGWWKFVPDASLIAEGESIGRTRNVAMRSVDGEAIAVYFASPATVKLRLDKITVGDRVSARWTNPATGEKRAGGTFDREARSFTPPTDWGDALLHVAAPQGTPQ